MRTGFWIVCGVWLVLVSGCSSSPEPRKPAGVLDNPEHHVTKGLTYLEEQRWRDAEQSFDRALELDAEYPEALSGKALALAYTSREDGRTAERQRSLEEQAVELQDQSESLAKDSEKPKARFRVGINRIRLEGVLQTGDWVEEAESQFRELQALRRESPGLARLQSEAHYRLAGVYQQALGFDQAGAQFREVLALGLDFTREADLALARLNDVARARPGSRHGKSVALADSITRADLAALLVEEFALADLYARGKVAQRPAYRKPEAEPSGSQMISGPASDLSEHPLRADVEEVLALGVRGLEVNPQKLFLPDETVTRAEYSLALEDILIKVLQDNRLASRFVGTPSPWSDVRTDAYYYNAARTVVDRDLLGLKNGVRGEFAPNAPISGAEALLGLRKLKDELNSYVRRS